MQAKGIEFFFDRIKWVFNEFLMKITVLDIPVLYYLIAIALAAIIVSGVINTAKGAYSNVTSYTNQKARDRRRSQNNKNSRGR